MKLWLLEILACPIDHAFPLELTILNWESEPDQPDQILKLIEGYKKGHVLPAKMVTPIKSERAEDGGLLVSDFLVLKPTPIKAYLESLLAKIEELGVVHDKSTWAGGEIALNLIRNELKKDLQAMINQLKSPSKKASTQPGEEARSANEQAILEGLIIKLEFLNLFKYHFEIEDGVIQCPKCKRWYPVFETIPQMLPDDVRDLKQDQAFKEKWAKKFTFV